MGDNTTLKVFKALNQRIIAFAPIYAKITGSLAGGVLLSQLLYWASTKNYKDEFFKTDKELMDETTMGRKELINAKNLVRRFFDIRVSGTPHKTFYRLKVGILLEEIEQSAEKDICKVPKRTFAKCRKGTPIYRTDTNTEITTDTQAPAAQGKKPKATIDGKAVNELLDAFKPVNPDYESFFGNNTQRRAAEWLISTYGVEEATRKVKFLAENNKTKFAHKATTPKQYRDRMGEIEAFWQQKKQEKAAALTAGRTSDGKKIIATPSGWVEKETSKPITGEPEVISEEEYNRRRNKLWAEAVKACGQCTDGYINLPDNTMALCHCVVDLKN